MIPYGRHTITKAEIEAVVQVLNSDFLTQGHLCQNSNMKFQNIGAKFGVAVNSATSALHIACLALDLNKMI